MKNDNETEMIVPSVLASSGDWAANYLIAWLTGDPQMRVAVQDYAPGNDAELGESDLRDWLENLLFLQGRFAYKPSTPQGWIELAEAKRIISREAFDVIDWTVVRVAVTSEGGS
jgi:hypothetical protein